MRLEDQCITLQMAQRLKELGVKQESYFSWIKHRQTAFPEPMIYYVGQVYEDKEEFGDGPLGLDVLAAAFTVAELGQLLPDFLTVDHYRMHFHSYKQDQYKKPALWTCTFGRSSDKEVPDFDRHNEAEARGALLIHLLESNLITVQEVNSRI